MQIGEAYEIGRRLEQLHFEMVDVLSRFVVVLESEVLRVIASKGLSFKYIR